MVNRRLFLKSALAANVALSASPLMALQLSSGSIVKSSLLVFSDQTLLDKNKLPGKISSDLVVTDYDVGQHFGILEQFCQQQPSGQILGLTRDSDFVVLRQLAAQNGFFPDYTATHEFKENEILHTVTAHQQLAGTIADSLITAENKWPEWLLQNTHIIARGHENSATVIRKTSRNNSYDQNQQGHFVSWLFSANKG